MICVPTFASSLGGIGGEMINRASLRACVCGQNMKRQPAKVDPPSLPSLAARLSRSHQFVAICCAIYMLSPASVEPDNEWRQLARTIGGVVCDATVIRSGEAVAPVLWFCLHCARQTATSAATSAEFGTPLIIVLLSWSSQTPGVTTLINHRAGQSRFQRNWQTLEKMISRSS